MHIVYFQEVVVEVFDFPSWVVLSGTKSWQPFYPSLAEILFSQFFFDTG